MGVALPHAAVPGRTRLILRDTTEVNSLAFSPDGECLASAGGDGAIKVWDSRTGKLVRDSRTHTTASRAASRSTPTASTWPPSARIGW